MIIGKRMDRDKRFEQNREQVKNKYNIHQGLNRNIREMMFEGNTVICSGMKRIE